MRTVRSGVKVNVSVHGNDKNIARQHERRFSVCRKAKKVAIKLAFVFVHGRRRRAFWTKAMKLVDRIL